MTKKAILQEDINFFRENGYLVVRGLISNEMVVGYQGIYDDFISGKIDVGNSRRDLKGSDDKAAKESITQIMIPSKYLPILRDSE